MMPYFTNQPSRFGFAACVALCCLCLPAGSADAGTHHHARKAHVRAAGPQETEPAPQERPRREGVVGYFGAPFYGAGYGYGPGPYWGAPRPQGDLGFAILGALNGGGFRGFVECGNYYARTPGACGF